MASLYRHGEKRVEKPVLICPRAASDALSYRSPVLYLGWAVASALDAYQIADKYCRP
ncbi:MAG: hypothetical protein N3E42_03270 [Candidatus Bipolaricaulota bacterium]|nr:hypothetical protein [Candidatus Bipolaricaulota bacterium]